MSRQKLVLLPYYCQPIRKRQHKPLLDAQLCWDKGQKSFYVLKWASGEVLEDIRMDIDQRAGRSIELSLSLQMFCSLD